MNVARGPRVPSSSIGKVKKRLVHGRWAPAKPERRWFQPEARQL
ncbi:hypothetical protein [Streptomyces sp. KR55]